MRYAVFGGRDYNGRAFIWRALDRLLERGPFVLVHGDCHTGADAHADVWARVRGVEVETHPADWKSYGRRGGPVRNRVMARSGLAGALEFPGGAGTANMRAECEAAGVSVWRPRFPVAALRGMRMAIGGYPVGRTTEPYRIRRLDAALDAGLTVRWVGRLSEWAEPSETGWRFIEARGWTTKAEHEPQLPRDASWRCIRWTDGGAR